MRFYGIALLASAAVLGACGGEKPAVDTAAANAAAASATTPAATTPAATTPAPAAGAVAAIPATGATHEVKMIGDATGYKFEPADVTVKAGDAVKFIMISNGPHNVAFTGIADAAVKAQLDANMPATSSSGATKLGELSGPLLMTANEGYTISFAGIPVGKYDFNCTPHLAMNMKGSITVK